MSSIRRHFNYSNVAATLALVFAMGGSAVAAKHYLITSTKQISPKVLAKLRASSSRVGVTTSPGAAGTAVTTGPTGPTGPTGAMGATGADGPQGAKGADGTPGAEGPPGLSALSTLPSGKTESGVFGLRETNAASGAYMGESVTFPIPLEKEIPAANIFYTPAATPTVHCSGPGHADRGYMCIYSASKQLVQTPGVENLEGPLIGSGGGRLGFTLEWKVTGTQAYDYGSYSVTAE